MGYLICDKCGGYYELQPGESPDDFSDECNCGGKLTYSEGLEDIGEDLNEPETTITCPYCGTENPEDKKICESCKRFLIPIKSPNKGKSSQSTPSPYTPRGKRRDEIIGTWNKQSTPIKAISLLGICCVGLILIVAISAMVSPDKTTTSDSVSSPQSTSAMGESEYRVKVNEWKSDMASVCNDVADVAGGVADGYLTEDEAYAELGPAQSTNQRILAEMQTTIPPDKFNNVHQNLLSAVTDCNNAISLIKSALTTKSTNQLEQAGDLIKTAQKKVEAANDEMARL